MWSIFQKTSFALINLGVLITFLYIVYIYPTITYAAPVFSQLPSLNLVILKVHIFTAIPPLLLGLVAFHEQSRTSSLKVHRWVGTIYCVTIWISSITGVLLAIANTQGVISKFGFGVLGVYWFFTTYMAYKTGRAKQIADHREWMIRSFSLTLAVVSVRPMFWFGPPSFMEPLNWYLLVSWLCWVPNYLIGDIYIRITKANGKLKTLKYMRENHRGSQAPERRVYS